MPLHFTPAVSGGWLALVNEPRLLVVAPPHDETFVAAAWAAIAETDGFQSLLDLLTSRGLTATPQFILVEWARDADARVIVRGTATVDVTDPSGSRQLAAGSVSTWVESTIASAVSLSLTIPGATASAAPDLPLEVGAGMIAGLVVTAGTDAPAPRVRTVPTEAPAAEAPAPVPTAAPAPTVEPEPIDVEATMVVELPELEAQPTPPGPVESDGYDYLFGETMHRSVADAAVHEPEEPDEADTGGEPDPAAPGDHDGHTVLTSDIAKLRRKRRQPAPEVAAAPPATQLVVVLSTTGARETLDQPIIVGRAPSVSQVSPGKLPKLMTIGGIDQDISRNHAQFALEGGTVVVTDLHSKNGTSVVLPGKEPQKLRAGEPTSVLVGTVIDLGGGFSFTVEEEQA